MAQPPRGKKNRAISYVTASANRRRDFRQSSDGPQAARRLSRKDTKRWCRGVVGREHGYDWVRLLQPGGEPSDFLDRLCRVCGRRDATAYQP
jgi:hypothetical protein